MNEQEQIHLMLKGVISELPQEKKDNIKSMSERIGLILSEDEEVAPLVLSLISFAMIKEKS